MDFILLSSHICGKWTSLTLHWLFFNNLGGFLWRTKRSMKCNGTDKTGGELQPLLFLLTPSLQKSKQVHWILKSLLHVFLNLLAPSVMTHGALSQVSSTNEKRQLQLGPCGTTEGTMALESRLRVPRGSLTASWAGTLTATYPLCSVESRHRQTHKPNKSTTQIIQNFFSLSKIVLEHIDLLQLTNDP